MEIRPISISDITALVRLGRRFFDESPYAGLMHYEEDSAKGSVEKMLHAGTGLLAEDKGVIQGFAGGLPVGMWFNREHLVMNCLAIWIAPEHAGKVVGARLVTQFIEMSRIAGYKQIIFSDLAGVRGGSVSGMYERIGMKRIETSWIWEE